jgi:serine/threonine-protein kinase RsbW
VEWQVRLPCLPSMVPVARRLARGLMANCPRLDDAELVLAELSANVVRYGVGEITVTVEAGSSWARLSVSDSGPAGEVGDMACLEDDFDERGRGLLIVDALADRWGHDHHLDGRNTMWAELKW